MALQNPDLALVLIVVLAAIVLIQSTAIIVAILLVGKRLGNLHVKTAKLSKEVGDALDTADQVLGKVQSIKEKFPVWEGHLSRASDSLARATREMDRSTGKALTFLRDKAEKTRQRSDTILTRFSQTTFRVHRSVIQPTHRLSAAVSAIHTGVVRYFSREPKGPRVDRLEG